MNDFFAAIFFIAGAFFMFLAGLGVYRFPDLFSRMHAATKAASFGIGLMLIGLMILYFSWYWMIFSALTILFVFITAPVAAHMLGRAAYWRNVEQYEGTIADEMTSDVPHMDDDTSSG